MKLHIMYCFLCDLDVMVDTLIMSPTNNTTLAKKKFLQYRLESRDLTLVMADQFTCFHFCNEIGSLCPTYRLVVFETGTFQFHCKSLTR